MLVDALQRLQEAGFPITEYQYTGFGAIYFVDFILFHKLLGMHHLLSIERERSLQSRVEFNRPFGCVEVRINPASAEIPSLSRDLNHVLWLDYDGVLHKDFLSDIQSALTILPSGSMLLVTVDVEPPEPADYMGVDPAFDMTTEILGPKHWKRYFEFHASSYIPLGAAETSFGKAELAARTADILRACFERSIVVRPDLSFAPMFNFIYRDSHLMLTMGGMIADPADRRKLKDSTLGETNYYRENFDASPFEITVPRLTRKERAALDRGMPAPDGWHPEEFDIEPDIIMRYRDIYRFLPAFAEILI
jgi:hypothetical protein